MPKLSDTMTEGTLVTWKKKKGDKVTAGEVIAEIETEIEAESAALAATEPSIEIVEVKPVRSGVSLRLIALAWVPQRE